MVLETAYCLFLDYQLDELTNAPMISNQTTMDVVASLGKTFLQYLNALETKVWRQRRREGGRKKEKRSR